MPTSSGHGVVAARRRRGFAIGLGIALIGGAAVAQAGEAVAPFADTSVAPVAAVVAPSRAANWSNTRSINFKRNWGVEIIGVKPVSSGYMLAFKYRIVDPDKARVLNDRKIKPYLVDEASGIVLAVPAMENIGELRQGATPIADRTYFMVFGNPGKVVKSGSRVSIVAGNFQVEGLVVD